MSHIVDFEIKGLAGNDKVIKYSMNRDINIFYGLNGSGKTSLLRILHSAMSLDPKILEIVPFEYARVGIYSINFDKTYELEFHKKKNINENKEIQKTKKSDINKVEETVPNKWEYIGAMPEEDTSRWRHVYLPTWRLYSAEFSRSYLRTNKENFDDEYAWDLVFAKELEQIWVEYSNTLLSSIQEIQSSGIFNILKAVLVENKKNSKKKKKTPSSDNIKTAFEKVESFLKRQGIMKINFDQNVFQKKYSRDIIFKDIVDSINNVEEKIDSTKSKRNELENIIKKLYNKNKQIIFKDNKIEVLDKSGINIKLASLSAGEKQVLNILIKTLMAESNSILVDEPEISLHVDWQSELIKSMNSINPSAQIIVTTHSPDIVSEIPNSKIFKL